MKQPQNKDQLGTRLVGYTMAAGALAGLAGNAHAQVTYSGLQDITLNIGESILLDLDGGGVNDFRFMVDNIYSGTAYNYNSIRYAVMMHATAAYSNSWLAGYTASSRLMVQGIDDAGVINSGASIWTNTPGAAPLGAFGDRYYSFTSISFTSLDLNGNFPGQTRFAGIRFMIGGNLHYGWIRVSLAMDVSQLTIHDWAYETTPGAGISADDAGPVPTMTPDVLSRTNVQEVNVNITFDEEASGLAVEDFTVLNGIAGSLTEVTPGLEYNLAVTSEAHGMVQVILPAGAVTDMFGNENDESVASWFYDDRIPTISLTDEYGGPTNIATQEVSIVFSEEVLGFDITDVNVSNGTAANLIEVVGDLEYTVEITASSEGLVTVEVPAAAVVDYGNNPNDVTSIEWLYDTTPPVVALDVPEAITSAGMQVVGINFNEEVDGFELADIVVNNGSASNLVEVTPGLEYTVEVTASSNGEVLVEVPLGAVMDLAGNENEANEISWLFDDVAPVVNLTSSVVGTANLQTVTVTITANETILDLSLGDIVVINGTAAGLTEVTPGVEYTVEITASATGEVSVELPTAAVTDAAGNPNEIVAVSWEYDGVAPSVTMDAGIDITNNASITLSLEFDEEITGLELTDFSVTNGTASNLVEVTAGTSYTVDITATADGSVSVELLAGAVSDAAGNENDAATTGWEYDGTAPVANVDAGGGGTTEELTVTVSVTFDEEVNGLELSDFNVTNGSASNLLTVAEGTSYTVDITATAEGEVTIELPAGAVNDDAGNENAAASDSFTYEEAEVGLETDFAEDIKIYPNPANGFLNIELTRASTVRILTASGRLVMISEEVSTDILDISNLSQGVYIIQIENDAGLFNQRFLVE